MNLEIYCVYKELEKNVICDLIEDDIVQVFECPVCHREIVLELK